MNALSLVRDLVALVAPPGEELPVREYLALHLTRLGYPSQTDSKGNLTVQVGEQSPASPFRVLVTAHMDEIGLIVTRIEDDGRVRVAPLGGAYAWKWGEGEVSLLSVGGEKITGVLSYGSIHTNHPESMVEFARHHPLDFAHGFVFTGKSKTDLEAEGVFPGVRAALAPSRRTITEFGDFIASYFLDDRVDLAVWLLALERLQKRGLSFPVTFAATTYEETGGEGARMLLKRGDYDLCIALEIGPITPESDFQLDAAPTIWVRDGYAAIDPLDQKLLRDACKNANIQPHWQYLSRGGSDASCASSLGLTARPVTLGFPVQNSHGYEIMHKEAPDRLCDLLLAYLSEVK